ncbi:hypothetical protein BN982_01955 [Halobacillus karajensis]|uniref:Uncharacterized protein n=1 Tax=Halobacillus karajensis TaxID=195088 RepID=A0A024P225_9BACI|nr:hypothetical protein BN982_01955 [Halobacillus karajensis]CDQ22113.1 hypothetical protein BN983_00316 [Halobacillus karajensis]CDQ27954.1 hypothetical protein BN981_02243 [Halobacillus karajensis]
MKLMISCSACLNFLFSLQTNENTEFNTQTLLDGDFNATFQIGLMRGKVLTYL